MAKGKYEQWLEPEGLLKIEGWARDGLTDEQIAHNMGIGTSTLYKWKNDYTEIVESLKRGKEVVDRQVENALLKRALGFEYDEVTFENGTETKRVRKMVVPDTTAQIFWLKNRKPDDWRDKQNIEHSGESGVRIINDIPRNRS
jgi:transposase-like protein